MSLDELKKQQKLLEQKLDDLLKKVDALVEADEEAKDILYGSQDVIEDEEFMDAVYIVCEHGLASSSLLQRRMQVGFNHAARILEMLEKEGVVGPPRFALAREVLITDAKEFLEHYLEKRFKN